MPRRQDNPYAPHDWAPHEKPALLGSPSTPLHSPAKRLAYGVVGLLVCLTGALGNAVVTANLQLLQGTFAAWSTEIAWLPAVYVMTNVSINLLLVKFRQQFGLRAFTEGFLVLYVLVTFFHLFVNDLSSAMMVRAAHGMVRGAQLAGDSLPCTGLACSASPERADYRHHRLVASHSWRASFPPNCCRPMNGAVSTSLSWAWRWCRWPASSR